MPLLQLDHDAARRLPALPPPAGVLLCPPEHYAVLDVKNAWMEGQHGRVDRALAARQWDALCAAYRDAGMVVHVLPAAPGREDMVFTCNVATVLGRAEGGADVVLSRMRHASRQAEVPHVEAWLTGRGLQPQPAPAHVLEGHGDVLAVPGRRLLLGGHGGRTERAALEELAARLAAPIVPLPLHGAPFYHLDTCLALLDERSVLWHPPAFTAEARRAVERLFPRRLPADPHEAEADFACNAHALPGGRVFVPAGARATAAQLRAAGYAVTPIDVSEFHRAGGSIFCLKLELPALPRSP